jgi:hypothetical protein
MTDRDRGTRAGPGRPGNETEEADVYTAGETEKEIVTIRPEEFRLPEVLRHIEAGRIVRVILPEPRPASD